MTLEPFFCFTLRFFFSARSSTLTAASAKTSTSSSVNENNPSNWRSHFATDGMMPVSSVNIFATNNEQTPWLTVTLDKISTIELVRVFNRRDGHGTLNTDISIYISCQLFIVLFSLIRDGHIRFKMISIHVTVAFDAFDAKC